MPTDTASDGRPRWRRLPAALIALVAGLALLTLAVPRTIASVVMLPGDPILNAVQGGGEVSEPELKVLMDSRQAALAWIDSGRLWTDLGLARLRLARKAGFRGVEGRGLLDDAFSSLRHGLALAPANPFAWARLGYVRLLRHGRSQAAAEALKMSILTGSHLPRLMFSRLRLSLMMWRYFDGEGRDLVKGQVRLAWKASPQKLVRLARRRKAEKIARRALADVPGAVAEFDRLVASP